MPEVDGGYATFGWTGGNGWTIFFPNPTVSSITVPELPEELADLRPPEGAVFGITFAGFFEDSWRGYSDILNDGTLNPAPGRTGNITLSQIPIGERSCLTDSSGLPTI